MNVATRERAESVNAGHIAFCRHVAPVEPPRYLRDRNPDGSARRHEHRTDLQCYQRWRRVDELYGNFKSHDKKKKKKRIDTKIHDKTAKKWSRRTRLFIQLTTADLVTSVGTIALRIALERFRDTLFVPTFVFAKQTAIACGVKNENYSLLNVFGIGYLRGLRNANTNISVTIKVRTRHEPN